MASEIIPGPPGMLKSDTPESSMGGEPQEGIVIHQDSLNNLIACITHLKEELQEISGVQKNLLEAKKEDATHPEALLPRGSPTDVENFQKYLSTGNCDQLLKMVKDSPPGLFLHTVEETYLRSALHVAVLEGSRDLVRALLEELKKLFGGDDSKLDENKFVQKKDKVGLSAADMAALIGNKEMVSCFSEQGPRVPVDLVPDIPVRDGRGDDELDRDNLVPQKDNSILTTEAEKTELLKGASHLLEEQVSIDQGTRQGASHLLEEQVSIDQGTRQLSLREWLDENNINFVYCLHHTRAKEFLELWERAHGKESYDPLKPLLEVRDNFGRSPLHAHVDNPKFEALFGIFVDNFSDINWNVKDFCGRTPLHWAAAQDKKDVVAFLVKQERTKVNARYGKGSDVTPLHLATLHNNVEAVETLLKAPKARGLLVNALCKWEINLTVKLSYKMFWTPIQLAAFMGHKRILRKFLKDPRTYDPGLMNGLIHKDHLHQHNEIPALHLAASQFYPSAMKTLVDCRRINTLVEDKNKNTALHYATKHAHEKPQAHPGPFDYVTVSHFTSKPPKLRDPSFDDISTCMDILMQSGVNMESKNKEEKTPNLHPDCPLAVKSWWLGKMAKEYQEIKNNLITAANAVSVTAALVATASFVGPLQPPLGLLDDENQTWLNGYGQVKHTSVQVFLFCDSLSFYLAIAAIVLAMLPSWPLPHEGLVQEVTIARRCVQGSVLLLFGSIIFVICSFTAASIAIMPDQRWRYMTLAVISTSLGVLICFLILSLSFMRLLALFPSNNGVVKKISDVATRILLWEPVTSRTNKEEPKSEERNVEGSSSLSIPTS